MRVIFKRGNQTINKKILLFFFIGLIGSSTISLIVIKRILNLQLDVSSGIKFTSLGKSFYQSMFRKNIIKHFVVTFFIIASIKFNRYIKVMCAMSMYIGLKTGMLLIMLISFMKWKGVVNLFLLNFPHGIFYVLAYYLLFLTIYGLKSNSISVIRRKDVIIMMIIIIFLVFLGILSETYINSYIIKNFFLTSNDSLFQIDMIRDNIIMV